MYGTMTLLTISYFACGTYRYPEKLLHYVTIVENKSKIFAGDDEKRDGDHNQVPRGGRH